MGTLDYTRLKRSAAGLKRLIDHQVEAPVRRYLLNSKGFPSFKVTQFTTDAASPFLINVWVVDGEQEHYKLAGGVFPRAGFQNGMVRHEAFASALKKLFTSDEDAARALDLIDEVISSYLTRTA
jgi:hypothetical protein